MLEAAQDFNFAAKSLLANDGRYLGTENLYGNLGLTLLVIGENDVRGAALPDQRFESVAWRQ